MKLVNVLSSALNLLTVVIGFPNMPSTCIYHRRGGQRLFEHVYAVFNLPREIQCYGMCWYSSRCASFNFNPRTGLCELSHSSKTDHPTDTVYSSWFIYAEVNSDSSQDSRIRMSPTGMLCPMRKDSYHACAKRPCKDTEICIPVVKASAHICVPLSLYVNSKDNDNIINILTSTSATAATTTAAAASTTDSTTVATTATSTDTTVTTTATSTDTTSTDTTVTTTATSTDTTVTTTATSTDTTVTTTATSTDTTVTTTATSTDTTVTTTATPIDATVIITATPVNATVTITTTSINATVTTTDKLINPTTVTMTRATVATTTAAEQMLLNVSYEYLGCYEFSPQDVIFQNQTADESLTHAICASQYCRGFTFFGMSNKKYCQCGNILDVNGRNKIENSRCQSTCKGDVDNSYCGQAWTLAVFKTGMNLH